MDSTHPDTQGPGNPRRLLLIGSVGTNQDEAERAEIERLTALPPADLAVEIMPAFGGPEGPRGGKEMSSLQVVIWLMRRHPRGTRNVDALHTAVREAMQVLEHERTADTQNRAVCNPAVDTLANR